ncbi:MAG: hypothetical protein AAF658_14470, partial [Myxococcota bacterium]
MGRSAKRRLIVVLGLGVSGAGVLALALRGDAPSESVPPSDSPEITQVTALGSTSSPAVFAPPDWVFRAEDKFWAVPETGDTDDGAAYRGEVDMSALIDRAANGFRLSNDGTEHTSESEVHRVAVTKNGVRFHPYRADSGGRSTRVGAESSRSARRRRGRARFDAHLEFDWNLDHVRLGDAASETSEPWVALGNTVQRRLRTANGTLVEYVEAGDSSVERSWILPEAPMEAADLEIYTSFSGLDYLETTEGGLHFADATGTARVRMTQPVLVDASGERTPLSVEHSGAGLRYRVSKETLAGRPYPMVVDPQLSAEVAIDVPLTPPSGDRRTPALAARSEGGAYVAWDDSRSGSSKIFTARVDANLYSMDGLGVEVATGTEPEIACDGAVCVVAYERDHDVWLRAYDFATGVFAGLEARVSNSDAT